MGLRPLSNILFLITLTGCAAGSAGNDPILDKLSNRGIIIVAPDNPYLAANQFLTKQTATSAELSGFLKLKGYPSAFELTHTTFGPLVMTFYYPSSKERYELEQAASAWVISGPFPLSDSALESLNFVHKEAPLQTPAPTPVVKPGKHKSAVPVTSASPIPSPTPTNPPATPTTGFTSPEPMPTKVEVTSALEHSSRESDLAELSPRGDLVHYVTMSGETLSIIARWYTEDRENASKIGRLNRMKNSDSLSIGDAIIIPSYMIKNKTRLSEYDLKRLADVADKEKRSRSAK